MRNISFFPLLFFISVVANIFAQDQTVGLFSNDSRSFNGYTLFNPIRSETTYLIDNCGRIVNSWTSVYKPSLAVYLLPDGNLLRTCNIDANPDFGGRLEILDWDGNVIWSFDFDSQLYILHHDIEILPNGNILFISNDIYLENEAILAGRDPSLIDVELWSEKIIEIEPVGTNAINIIWEWKAWDHMIQDYDISMNNFGVVEDHPELLNINYYANLGSTAARDWLHFNTVSYNADLDQILLCARSQCEIYIIDHSTTTGEAAGHSGGTYGKGGDLLYRFGNPAAYNRGNIDDRKLFFQHDSQWIPDGFPDEGKIILFNNQVSPTTSSIVMITPPIDSAGYYSDPGQYAYGPDNFAWIYESDGIHSTRISGTEQLPNGNVLICSGVLGIFQEVDMDGNLLWEYRNPVGGAGPVSQGAVPLNGNVFKCRRYAPDFSGFTGKELIPGDPIELNPWPGECEILEDSLANIDLKVFLQGPFNGSTMNTDLTSNPELVEGFPLLQPFNIPPWDYKGAESLRDLPEADIVDWLLIEYRDAVNPGSAIAETTISRRAAFLLADGSVVGVDGSSALEFYNTINHNLHIVIWHRNHLGILSALSLVKDNEYLTYDFTLSQNQVYNNSLGYVELSTGIWGMAAGDANQDQKIGDTDLNASWKLHTGLEGYLPADFNLDRQVDNLDKNDYWFFNKNMASQVP